MIPELKDHVVTLKVKDNHQIWILKGLVNKYKYLGIYSKKIDSDKFKTKNKGISNGN